MTKQEQPPEIDFKKGWINIIFALLTIVGVWIIGSVANRIWPDTIKYIQNNSDYASTQARYENISTTLHRDSIDLVTDSSKFLSEEGKLVYTTAELRRKYHELMKLIELVRQAMKENKDVSNILEGIEEKLRTFNLEKVALQNRIEDDGAVPNKSVLDDLNEQIKSARENRSKRQSVLKNTSDC